MELKNVFGSLLGRDSLQASIECVLVLLRQESHEEFAGLEELGLQDLIQKSLVVHCPLGSLELSQLLLCWRRQGWNDLLRKDLKQVLPQHLKVLV